MNSWCNPHLYFSASPWPHKWKLQPLIWRSPCICSWQLPLIYLPHPVQIRLVLLVKYILCISSAATLVHLGLLQETSAGVSTAILGPDITPYAGARTIFFKPMITHVTHLIKTFQWLSISLKIQAKVLKAATSLNMISLPPDFLRPSRSSPLGPCWPLQTCCPSSSSVTLLHVLPAHALHSVRTICPQHRMKWLKRTSLLIYEKSCSDSFFKK